MNEQGAPSLTASQQAMGDLWHRHVLAEFVTKNVEDALETMTQDAHVLLIPVLTGGVGKDEVRKFYSHHFIPQMPPDMESILVSQTIGDDRLVEEAIYKFTHSMAMEWMLPGIAPTGKRIEVAVVGIIHFREDKIAHEHLYWDQASVLVQLGLLDADTPAVAGVASARKLLDPILSSRN